MSIKIIVKDSSKKETIIDVNLNDYNSYIKDKINNKLNISNEYSYAYYYKCNGKLLEDGRKFQEYYINNSSNSSENGRKFQEHYYTNDTNDTNVIYQITKLLSCGNCNCHDK